MSPQTSDPRPVLAVTLPSGHAAGSDATLDWAVSELDAALCACGAALDPGGTGRRIALSLGAEAGVQAAAARVGVDLPGVPEALALFAGPDGTLHLHGADMRGLVYAVTELADRLRCGGLPVLDGLAPHIERPANRVRSISKCFQSREEDLGWFRDPDYWDAYLTHLVTHRFNRITLTLGMQYNYPYGNEFLSDVYLYLAYPFLVAPEGHAVTIDGLGPDERARNLDALRHIGRAAARRGLDFQLALWTQSYDFDECPGASHRIGGLGPANIAAYARDATAQILAEVPEIGGLTLRVHVECGIPEGDYDFWRTYFQAVTGAGRPIRLDLHAKGIDAEMIGIALDTGMPVTVSPKYTSEHFGLPYHQASIRALEAPVPEVGADDRVAGRDIADLYSGDDREKFVGKWRLSEGSRKFMRYSYGDLLREDRAFDIMFRIWPGTQRVLLWADPALAAGYGRNGSFAGAAGIELCEPLSFKGRMGTGIAGSRTGLQPQARIHAHDWQKFAQTYRVWGRALYAPGTDPEAFDRGLVAQFGPAGVPCGRAIASASRILPLITLVHTPTASNNSYWPEIYENMSILHEAPRLPYGYEMTGPARFGTVGSCDPQMFLSPAEFAARLQAGRPVDRIAPLTWANWLERHATDAMCDMAGATTGGPVPAALDLVRVDVTIQAAIGLFFARKCRAAVLWEYHLLTGAAEAAAAALRHYSLAREAWALTARAGSRVYLPDLTYGPHSWLRGRWDDRLPAIDRDIADMAARIDAGDLTRVTGDPVAVAQVARIEAWTAPQVHPCAHVPPPGFHRDQPLPLSLVPAGAPRRAVRLHVRPADQTAAWIAIDMSLRDGRHEAVVPAAVTATAYPLLYYFELAGDSVSEFHPGFTEDLSGTPYYTLRRIGA